jgi:hypothetical protein
VSPILVRPVREQLEHDRVIRLLQSRWRRRYEVAANVGDEKIAPFKAGTSAIYPDLLLYEQQRGRKLEGVIEVETGESVNHLEALAQWSYFAKGRVPFFLYVPANMIDVARRLCASHDISVHEVWSYHTVGEEIRFTLVQRAPADRKVAAGRAEGRKAEAPPSAKKSGPRKGMAATPPAPKTRARKGARKNGIVQKTTLRKSGRTAAPAARRASTPVRRKSQPRPAPRSSRPKTRAKRR